MRTQKLDLDSRYMEAEARHRSTASMLRKDMAEIEVRHADALNKQEEAAARRLSAAERDFAAVLRGLPLCPGRSPAGRAEEATGEGCPLSASSATPPCSSRSRSPSEENTLQRALNLLRRRADLAVAAGATADEDLAEALAAERERSDRQLASVERHHSNALVAAREAGERRLLAAEARHAEELGEVQAAAAGATTAPAGVQSTTPAVDWESP